MFYEDLLDSSDFIKLLYGGIEEPVLSLPSRTTRGH